MHAILKMDNFNNFINSSFIKWMPCPTLIPVDYIVSIWNITLNRCLCIVVFSRFKTWRLIMKCVDLQSFAGTSVQTDDVIYDGSTERWWRWWRGRTRRASASFTGWAQSQREEKGCGSHQQSECVGWMWVEACRFFCVLSSKCRNPVRSRCCFGTDARGLQFKQPLGPKQNSRLLIFDENKATETEPQEPKFEIWTAPPTARAKENEQKPEKWTNVKVWVLSSMLMLPV